MRGAWGRSPPMQSQARTRPTPPPAPPLGEGGQGGDRGSTPLAEKRHFIDSLLIHLVLCYMVLSLVMNYDKEKNKDEKI